MKIIEKVLNKVLSSYPMTVPESGGIFGSNNGVVTEYYHDSVSSITNCAMYVPNVENLNAMIKQWSLDGIDFCGMIHSHPENQTTLSGTDIDFIYEIMKQYEVGDILYFPIILPGNVIVSYSAIKEKNNVIIKQDEINIVCEGGENKWRRKT